MTISTLRHNFLLVTFATIRLPAIHASCDFLSSTHHTPLFCATIGCLAPFSLNNPSSPQRVRSLHFYSSIFPTFHHPITSHHSNLNNLSPSTILFPSPSLTSTTEPSRSQLLNTDSNIFFSHINTLPPSIPILLLSTTWFWLRHTTSSLVSA